jgi:hypothetical protein
MTEPQSFHIGIVSSVSGSMISAFLRTPSPETHAGEHGAERAQIGALVRIPTRTSLVYGLIHSLRIEHDANHPAGESRIAEIQVLGEVIAARPGAQSRFERGVSTYPALGAQVFTTTQEDLKLVYAPPTTTIVRIGSLAQDTGVAAYVLTDELLGKHFAILGTTGCGKSCTVALVLRSILAGHPQGHVVVLDPHNEYARAFGSQAEQVRATDLDLPYWILNFEESASLMTLPNSETRQQEIAILKGALLEARQRYNNGRETPYLTVDTPSPYRIGDLVRCIDQKMGEINKADNSVPFLRLKSRIEALGADRRLGFIFPGHVVRDNLQEILARLLRIPVSGKPLTLLDISGMPGEVVDVVVSVICRMLFDYCVWSDRARSTPVLLVCEEAHRYVPHAEGAGFEPTKRALSRIAKEGRKYGISLCLVTQRPSELSMSILSQCNTLFALRMSNERDHEFVRNALPESAQSFLSALPSLRTQEAIVMGEGVSVPMHVRFDNLPAEHRPHSDTATFSESWRRPDSDQNGLIAETIRRWRYQGRETDDPAGALRSIVDSRSRPAAAPLLRPKLDRDY